MPKKTLSVASVAERLEVHPTTITRWIQQGHFPHAYKLNPDARNSPYRIPETDVTAFEEKRLENAGRSTESKTEP